VQADRQSNVRVLQEAVVPVLPRPTRKLILVAGAILSLVGAAGVALASHFLRRVYLVPEAVEADTGLRVLCSVPNGRRRAIADLAVRPS
jgi:capsular polysaccharide biosynthesis protein